MDINRGAQQNSRYLAARSNEKGCLQVSGGDALSSECSVRDPAKIFLPSKLYLFTYIFQPHPKIKLKLGLQSCK
jgi:hypothetical protein